MKGKRLFGIGLVIVIVAGGLAYAGVMAAPNRNGGTPAQVVANFYDWYLGYIGEGETRQNPLVDGAYRDCGYLTDGFVAEIDQTLASFDKGGFDPLLMAQDVPERVTVAEATVEGAEAQVKVAMFWGNNPTPSERTVNLKLVEGAWKIVGVSH